MNTNNQTTNGNITMDVKTMIVDLVNKIKYEVTPEQLAELSGSATPLSKAEFVDWHAKIDALDLNKGPSWMNGEYTSQLRAFLHQVLDVTHNVGGKVVRIGKRIIKWIFMLIERYPDTFRAAVVLAALSYLVANIPFLGALLLPIMQLVAVGIIGFVFLGECVRNVNIKTITQRVG